MRILKICVALCVIGLQAYGQIDRTMNFGKSNVRTGYATWQTAIVLTTGGGAKFPDPATNGPFNLVWWNSSSYADPSDDPYREIVRCTARSGDTLTIARAREGTYAQSHNLAGKTYRVILAITAQMWNNMRDSANTAGGRMSPSTVYIDTGKVAYVSIDGSGNMVFHDVAGVDYLLSDFIGGGDTTASGVGSGKWGIVGGVQVAESIWVASTPTIIFSRSGDTLRARVDSGYVATRHSVLLKSDTTTRVVTPSQMTTEFDKVFLTPWSAGLYGVHDVETQAYASMVNGSMLLWDWTAQGGVGAWNSVAMSGDVTITRTGATAIGLAKITYPMFGTITPYSLLANPSGLTASPVPTTFTTLKTSMGLNLVENTALSTYSRAGTGYLLLSPDSTNVTMAGIAPATHIVDASWNTNKSVYGSPRVTVRSGSFTVTSTFIEAADSIGFGYVVHVK